MMKNKSFDQWNLGQLMCVKIGSTFYPGPRKSAYTPYAPTPWEYMALIKIKSARGRNAYDIDDHLKKMSSLRKFNVDGGGTEWYHVSGVEELCEQLRRWRIDFEIVDHTTLPCSPGVLDIVMNENIEMNERSKTKKLFFYQQDIVDSWDCKRSGVVCLATGLGKTTTLCAMCDKFRAESTEKKKIVWHTNRKDILFSQKKQREFQFDTTTSIGYCIGQTNDMSRDITICNSDQLSTVVENVHPSLIITDECHDITADDIFEILEKEKKRGCIMIGASATPIKKSVRKSQYRMVLIYDNHYLSQLHLMEAIAQNLLAPITIEWIHLDTRLSHIQQIEHCSDHVLRYIENAKGKTICWANTVDSANEWYVKLLEKRPNLALSVSHSRNDPNCKIITDFIESKNLNSVLICVDRFRQGVNDPTLTLGLHLTDVKKRSEHVSLQMWGRLGRKHPIKNNATFVDVCEYDNEEEKEQKLISSIFRYFEDISLDQFKIHSSINGRIEIIHTGTENVVMTINVPDVSAQLFTRTLEDLRIKYSQKMSMDAFIRILSNHNVSINNYHQFMKNNPHLKLPENYQQVFKDFRWSMVEHSFYTVEEYVKRMAELHHEHFQEFEDDYDTEKAQLLHEKDNRMPSQVPWKYYENTNKEMFRTVFG
jgi:superfamily II DNA or RNA helicase